MSTACASDKERVYRWRAANREAYNLYMRDDRRRKQALAERPAACD